jgi:uncharacterized protein involved in exopolysaccharide biosynthesis
MLLDGNCAEKHANMQALNDQMGEAYKRMVQAIQKVQTYLDDPSIPLDVAEIASLKQQAAEAQEEIDGLGKRRLDAFFEWADCLLARVSN